MIRILCFMILGWLCLGITATAAPLKIESENIILYGDIDEVAGQKILSDLEVYRRTIFALVGREPVPADVKLTIYSFDASKPLARYVGNRGTAGLYTQGAEGPIFITTLKAGRRTNTWDDQVAKHEFSHHVLHAIVRDSFPRWYDEGFANFLSTFQIDGTLITVGNPAVKHANVLEREKNPRYIGDGWMDVDDVLRSIRVYPWHKSGADRSLLVNAFYAQSWLYVHYMQNHPEYGNKLPAYLKALKTEDDPLQAFEGAFGISPENFHAKARAYFKADNFPLLQFEAKPAFLNVATQTTSLSEAALATQMLMGQRAILSDNNADDFRKRLKRAETGDPTAQIQIARAEVALLDKSYAEAVSAAQAALALTPKASDALRIMGDAALAQSHAAVFEDLDAEDLHAYRDTPELHAALGWYARVLAANPKDRQTVKRLLSVYGRSDLTPDDDILRAARWYDTEIFRDEETSVAMDLAVIYKAAGDKDRACYFFSLAERQTKAVKTRFKNDMAARLEAFRSPDTGVCST